MALRRVVLFFCTAAAAMTAAPLRAAAQDVAGQNLAAQNLAAQDRPTVVASAPAPVLHGIWRSRGYGYVLSIGSGGLQLFHAAGSFCYADPRPKQDPDGLFAFFRRLDEGAVAFSAMPGQTRYVFDRLPGLPAACNDRAPWTPPRIAVLVHATFADLYPTFAERGIDWRARMDTASRELDARACPGKVDAGFPKRTCANDNDAALFEALRMMLAGIDDAHVELHAEVAGGKRALTPGQAPTLVRADAVPGGVREDVWDEAYRRGVRDVVLAGREHVAANERVIWGRVGDIGYINILAMERFSADTRRVPDDPAELDAALDAAMAAFAGARAVIVDVSVNDGGFDWLAQRIAGRFAERARLAYTKEAIGAHGVAPQQFEVVPSDQARYLGPVYMLTSDVTLSAAEVFALLMRALPNVIHVGTTTRGAFSDTVNKPLPNGWMLVLPTEIYRDPAGRTYEARGLPPQRAFEVFPSNVPGGGHARRVLALIDDIRRELHVAAPAR
jgi:carboxyl-terminal processing protease